MESKEKQGRSWAVWTDPQEGVRSWKCWYFIGFDSVFEKIIVFHKISSIFDVIGLKWIATKNYEIPTGYGR